MRIGAFEFRPRAWGLLLAAIGCAAGVALGHWQWGRAAERRATLERIDAAARAPAIDWPSGAFDAASLVRRRVAVTGEFLPGYTVLLDYRLHRGRPGFHVVQPLRVAGSGAQVLVLRGWIAAPARREWSPQVITPGGTQRIEGLALDRLPQFLEPPVAAEACRPGPAPCVWQNLKIESFASWAGIPLAPVMLEQASDLPDGLARDWERAEAGYRKNEMYALQWYSLAGLSLALLIALSLRRRTPSGGPGNAG
jgi:cytochrome oxidase assembly protein ShyY1